MPSLRSLTLCPFAMGEHSLVCAVRDKQRLFHQPTQDGSQDVVFLNLRLMPTKFNNSSLKRALKIRLWGEYA